MCIRDRIRTDDPTFSQKHVALLASAFAGEDGGAMLRVAGNVDVRSGSAHGAYEDHDAPDVVIRQPERWHCRTRNAVLDGVEDGIFAQPEEAAISHQRGRPLSFCAIHAVACGAGSIEDYVTRGNDFGSCS